MDEWGENFCYNICYARKEYGLTQAEMAGILGISVRKLRRIERMDPTVQIGMRDGVHWKFGIGLKQSKNRKITARIPHQSKIKDFCQLPPGGSLLALPRQ